MARQSLTRIAGKDLGMRERTWTRWAYQRHPELYQRALKAQQEEAADKASEEDLSVP